MGTENITLNNGMQLPRIGFGTCKHDYGKTIDSIVLDALDAGYRYLDTASFYATERDIGRAVKESGLDRGELFIATKLWYEELGYKNAKEALSRSLDRLQTDHVDLYLIHWPKASADDESWKETVHETWRALEEMQAEGLTKAIGVSNFLPHHMEVLLEEAKVTPCVDQLELHPGYFQEYAVRYLQEKGIQPQAWSPIGRGSKDFSSNAALSGIAERYGVSIQKLSLRFLTQRGIMPLPWSTSKEHMKSNLDIFDFTISDEDMSMISCLPPQGWLGEHPDFYLPVGKHLDLNQ